MTEDADAPAQEVYQLWAAGDQARHRRLDDLFRQRLRARDEAGCRTLLAAVEQAGGGTDPLLALCHGLIAGELTRDWGAAETHFHAVLAAPDVPVDLRARALMELGLQDRYQGRYPSALRYLAQSCAICEQAGSLQTLARALTNRGVVCTEGWTRQQLPHHLLDEALECHIRARDLFLQLGMPEAAVGAWNNLGTVYKAMGQLDQALAAYGAALDLTPADRRFTRAILINNSAEIDVLQGRLAQAQAAYEDVLAIWRESGGDFEIVEALVNLGDVQERRGLTEEAIASYQQAIAAVESLRSRLKAEEARSGFLATRLAPYERVIALCLASPDRMALAFEMVERAKARAFIELLANQPLRPPQAVPRPLLDRERSLREALAHLYQMGVHAGAPGPAGERAATLEDELEDVYRQLRRLDAQYTGLRTVDTLSLAEVRRRLPEGQALLEYFSADQELGCFVIANGRVHGQLLPGLSVLAARAMESPVDATVPSALGVVADPELSQALFAAALAPIVDLLAGCADLIVVPHGALHYLPLHALGAGTPLLARHRVCYAPSASILLRERPQPQSVPQHSCLALGYGGDSLHYADLEARHVAQLTGGMAHVGEQATAERLLREGGAYRALHLVCHGTFNPRAPLASGLLLADGKLDAMTVMQNLRLHADLVVLSACDTGQAQVLRGDELMGLARAFLYAGAAAVVVSLWPVDDLATALLMDAFYRARAALPADRAGAAEALRQAQRELRAMTVEEALIASERLRAAITNDEQAAWTDAALASLHTLAGDQPGATLLATRARAALSPARAAALDEQRARGLTPDGAEAQGARPYAHPFFWAAFILVCG
ncbi:MAG TPA: CHAT domain-containing protein [Chloroflexota bacterium]|nr:CHAT domain-containing protein [Chloroflexota bacterium]